MMKHFFILIIVPFLCFSQVRKSPVEIETKSEYVHKYSGFGFPEIWRDFKRERLISYDEKNYDIGATYSLKENKKTSTISIYIYPSQASNENLSEQFIAFKEVVSRNSGNAPLLIPEFIKLKSDKVIITGIKSVFKYNVLVPDFFKGEKEKKNTSIISLYDCGIWNVKFRMTSEIYDESKLKEFEESFVKSFNIIKIAEENNFKIGTKASIVISKTAQRDSLMLKSIIVEAESKRQWLEKNKSANELSTGINDFDIEPSVFALEKMVEFYDANKNKWQATDETKKYLEEISRIVKAGKTKDFIFDRKEGLVIYEDGNKNKEDYLDFKIKNDISEPTKELMYKIFYE